MQSYLMDQLPVVIATLSQGSIYPLNTLDRKISYFASLIFLSLCTYELFRQYLQTKRLHRATEEKMTALDKGLSDFYFDGLCQEEISSSWYVRNYNLLFTLRLVVVAFFIVSMQYLQILQVFLSFLVMLLFLIASVINFRKLKVFE